MKGRECEHVFMRDTSTSRAQCVLCGVPEAPPRAAPEGSRANRVLSALEWRALPGDELVRRVGGEAPHVTHEVLCGLIVAGLVRTLPDAASAGTFDPATYALTARGRATLEVRREEALASSWPSWPNKPKDFRCDWDAAVETEDPSWVLPGLRSWLLASGAVLLAIVIGLALLSWGS